MPRYLNPKNDLVIKSFCAGLSAGTITQITGLSEDEIRTITHNI